MPVIGINGDLAGGAVTATTARTIQGLPVLRIGDPVASHGTGSHAVATMAQGSARMIVEGIGVCRMGDLATCGHALIATGIRIDTA